MRSIGKKICAGALALVMSVSMLPGVALAAESLDNFQRVNAYAAGTFTDVAADSWYADNVKDAYELDLVKGSSATTFSPTQNITIGSALALSCRLHSIYHTGKADFQQGEPWYQVYVDYAISNDIIASDEFTDYNATATRRQFAGILAKSLPSDALKVINQIEPGDIPDVDIGSSYGALIYFLYGAGILTGSDKYGTFLPETPIDRASVATIVSRMALPGQRKQLTLEEKEPEPTPGTPTLTPGQLSSLKNDIDKAGEAIAGGQRSAKIVEDSSMPNLVGPTSTLLIMTNGVTAVGFLDLARDVLKNVDAIPISYDGYTSLQELIKVTRDDLWNECSGHQNKINKYTWSLYFDQGCASMDKAERRIAAIQEIIATLG